MKKLLICSAIFLTAATAKAQEPATQTQTTTTVTTTINQQSADSSRKADSTAAAPARVTPAPAPVPTYTSDNDSHKGYDLRRFYLGGRVLLTVTDLDFNKSANGTVTTKAVTGYGIGGFLGYNFTQNFAMQAELLYQSLAQNVTFSGLDHKLHLKYVNIPLLFVLNTNVTKPVNFNICAGPQIGIRVNSSIDADAGSATDTIKATLAVKPGDFGLAYGAGLDFQVSEGLYLSIGYRGVLGLIDISENNQNATTSQFYILDRSKVRTNSGYLGLHYAF